jgi:Mce-associated membrane protein
MVVTMAVEETVDPTAPAPPPCPQWRKRAPRVAIGAVALVAVAVAVVQWRHAHELGGRESARRRVATVAGTFGESLLTYDYQHLDEARKRLLRNGSTRFARDYTGALSDGLEAAITGLEARSTASVRDVYVTDVVGQSARAVVTLDSEVRSSAATRRTVSAYLDMALVLQGGRWKVDSVINVASLDEQTRANPAGAAPSPESETSPTSEPPTSQP